MKRILLMMLCIFPAMPAWAFESWQLWQRPDQHEAVIVRQGNQDYRAGEWSAADAAYAKSTTPLAHYNRGNALAHAGNIQGAIDAYEQALKLNPNDADAKYNRDLLKQLPPQSSSSSGQQPPPPPKPSPSSPPPPPRSSRASPQEQSQRWLNQVSDDPGGLLRQKFLRDHQKMLVEGQMP